ncbi:TPA: ATP-binding protein [Yersinia enterocolitica]|uniref:ATP-binding protein n=1 Tax=Yersinia enterocolitica TaxID=630 RepID=UPI0005E00BF3|nr:ATP-binding protein [Yersinia enterocolitica]CQH44226.1 Histidine kinase-%2C DNA gyrase B-%2C and HSP90-like ATPase [Yersinia enterocolitica]HDL8537597.1 ATP-binding protein [Yersinia enterocolitica]HDL8752784.1 ATP-binding protein [Yersinia enterocolitica]
MAREHKHPPSAACLSASMRDLGYSIETAIADLIDNSISAAADVIDIISDVSCDQPVVVILDNGRGMTEDELLDAMRHGTRNPQQYRSPQDLGRFGLGLKTASFSQCRLLTVLSARDGNICGAEWDLDRINVADDWILSILDETDVKALPYVERLGSQGTAIIWRKLDRIVEDLAGEHRDEMVNEKLGILEKHLSLVFHRFIDGDVKKYPKVKLTINGHPIASFDPFCRNNSATQVLPEDIVRIGESEVRLQPYILPHHTRLSTPEYNYYRDRSDFISNQGAYVYRNGRLMVWGDWFRLVPKGEATKLARVQIDFPNNLDEVWTIDIKKSRARPPHAVRERLRQIIAKVTARSVMVHRGRGQKLFQESKAPFWERYADQDGIRYVVNKQHPLIVALDRKLLPEDTNLLHVLLDSIAASLPVEMLYSDYSTHPRELNQKSLDEKQALERLKSLWQVLYGEGPGDANTFLQIVRSTHLFDYQIELAKKFIKEEFA